MRISPLQKAYIMFLLTPVLIMSAIAGNMLWVSGDSLTGITILIDPGHGGVDPGANVPGIAEKDINLAVALKLQNVLQQYGANVVLTREIDTDLSSNCNDERVRGRHRRDLAARIELVEEVNAQIFISIHANSNPSNERQGAQTFYWHESERSKMLANSIHTELQKHVISDTKANPGNYFLLKKNVIPAALVEVGYITHIEESQRLLSDDYQAKIASAITNGILKFCQLNLQ